MADVIEYITKQGDTWDKIADEKYGDAFRVSEIINANPNLEIKLEFEEGEVVYVPILEGTSSIDNSLLPAWKRTS